MHRKDGEPTKRSLKKERELQACESRLRTIMTKSPYGIMIIDSEGSIRFANPTAAAILGCSAQELGEERFAPPDKPGQVTERKLPGPDGKTIVVELWGEETEWDSEKAWVVTLTDVTERRQAEEALRESEERFRLMADTAPVMIWMSDPDSLVTFVNKPWCDFVGRGPQQEQGNGWAEGVHPDDLSRCFDTYLSAFNARQDFRMEYRLRRADGEYRWIFDTGVPRFRPSGDFAGYIGSCFDVTERRRAEDALRESEERHRRLYNETPVMLHSIDQEGCLVSVSDYWLETLGYERSEVLGRRTTEFLTEASRRYAEEIVLPEFFRTGSCKDVPYQVVKKNGEILDVLLSAIAEWDSEGKVIRSLAVMTDVTARKQAEEAVEKLNTDLAARAAELEAANRELEAFSYSVSHDLRKPLTVINGYCQIIRELCGSHLNEQCLGYLREIDDATMRMNELIDALLRFSCVARNELNRESVDLSRIAKTVAAELALTEPGRRVTFRIADGLTVNGDPGLLRLVLENLLGNAWKYTAGQEEAVIEFGVADIDGNAAWFVRDNGTGFAMAEAEKLFLPFQRLSGADAFKGHGIGLATVQRIVLRHGGRVWAEGKPGKGATFYFTL